MPDNQDPNAGNGGTGNPDPNAGKGGDGGANNGGGAGAEVAWKAHLGPDLGNSPTMKKFSDDKNGLIAAAKGYVELEKLLGHEKIPVPKDANDTAALEVFRRAFKIPENPDGYGLADAQVPETMKGVSFDKATFAAVMHKHNVPPENAKGMWAAYTEMVKGSYAKAVQAQKDALTGVINGLRTEWGDSYDAKVELGQTVINKFSEDQETNDYLTSALSKDPRGIRFLSKIGEQFAENKIGDFKYSNHALSPADAQKEIDEIRRNPQHPYVNDKASPAERKRAIEHVNSLYAIVSRAKG